MLEKPVDERGVMRPHRRWLGDWGQMIECSGTGKPALEISEDKDEEKEVKEA
jgi:hypothetical protein